jgi:hypothetical protein
MTMVNSWLFIWVSISKIHLQVPMLIDVTQIHKDFQVKSSVMIGNEEQEIHIFKTLMVFSSLEILAGVIELRYIFKR